MATFDIPGRYRPQFQDGVTAQSAQQGLRTYGQTPGFNILGGRTGAIPPPKKGYTLGGEQVDVEPSRTLGEYDPNVGYAGPGHMFASDPRSTIGTLQAAQNLRAGEQALQSVTPRVSGAPAPQVDPMQALQLQQKAAEDMLRMRMSYLPQLLGQIPGQVSLDQGIGGQEEAARGAAFARAKEQAGQTALSALLSLQDLAAERGQTGSSMERQMIGDVVGGAAGAVGDFTREQLIQDLNRARDIRNLQYQGGITQRGQNMAMMPSLLGLLQAGGGLY